MQKNTLLPGDSTVVELIYDTHTYKGKVSKNAKVITNDTTLTIDLAADVFSSPDSVSKIRFTPDKVEFNKDDKTDKQTVIIQNLGNAKMELTEITNPIDNMKLKIKDDQIKPGKTGKIEFEWKGDYPKSDLASTITFETALDSMPRFTVPYVIKGTEPPPRPIPPKPVVSQIPSTNKPQTGSPTRPGTIGQEAQPKPVQSPGTFEPPKVPPDTAAPSQVKPAPKEEPKSNH